MAQTRERGGGERHATHGGELRRNSEMRKGGGKEGEGAAKKEGNLEAACIHLAQTTTNTASWFDGSICFCCFCSCVCRCTSLPQGVHMHT